MAVAKMVTALAAAIHSARAGFLTVAEAGTTSLYTAISSSEWLSTLWCTSPEDRVSRRFGAVVLRADNQEPCAVTSAMKMNGKADFEIGYRRRPIPRTGIGQLSCIRHCCCRVYKSTV